MSLAPRPDHQAVVFGLAKILDAYVSKHKLAWVFISPADLEFSPRRLEINLPEFFQVALG